METSYHKQRSQKRRLCNPALEENSPTNRDSAKGSAWQALSFKGTRKREESDWHYSC
jgi:hypothetical protein